MSQHKPIYTYNPLNQTDEELLENFVIRKLELQRVLRSFQNSSLDGSAQNFLIEGQRGTGKTSLLMRIRYAIEHEKELSYLIPIQFSEEQYGVFDLCRFWEKTAELLEESEGFVGLCEALESKEEDGDYHQECFYILEKYLIKAEKRLLLLVDNFGDLLDNISQLEAKRLRDIFHSSKYIQIVAATAKSLEHTYKHDKPFFEFFKTIRLEGLDKKETNLLLKQLAYLHDLDLESIIENQPSRIETMRRLTGGIPRTIVLLFEVFLDQSADVFEDLEKVLEKVTPLYKHRMDELPKQQKAIMDTIALNWDGIRSKEIVEGLKKRMFDTKSVSAQLKLLERNGLIISDSIDKRNKIYFIKERFFNIWYLMRYGKKSKKSEVIWLARFLRDWCSDDELMQRFEDLNALIDDNKVSKKGATYLLNAYEVMFYEMSEEYKIEAERYKSEADKLKNDLIDYKNIKLAFDSFNSKDNQIAQEYFSKVVDKTLIFYLLGNKFLNNNLFDKAFSVIGTLLSFKEMEINYYDMVEFTKLALAKNQYHLLHKLFEDFPDLKKEFKPLYYALMVLLKDEFPKEHLKMGGELKETVDEILESVKKLRVETSSSLTLPLG